MVTMTPVDKTNSASSARTEVEEDAKNAHQASALSENGGFDAEKHERPATISESDFSSDSSTDVDGTHGQDQRRGGRFSLSRVGSARSGRSLGRTVSEVRDGIRNERDLEIGEQDEKDAPPGGSDAAADPNLVRWDGPDDPQNPKNWSINRKWAAVFCGMYSLESATVHRFACLLVNVNIILT